MKTQQFVAKGLLVLTFALLVVGCANSSPVRWRVMAGMTPEQVAARCGEPNKISQDGAIAIWAYEWNSPYDMKVGGLWDYVYLENGYVVGAQADTDQPAKEGFDRTWGPFIEASQNLQRAAEHQQEINAYNARTQAIAAPKRLDINMTGSVSHYHRFSY